MPHIRIIAAPGLRHIIVIHHETLLDYTLWYPGFPDELGDIHYGRVTTYRPGLGGAFILLSNQKSGFLPDKAGAKNIHEGDKIVVKITRSAQGGKDVRLDARDLPAYSVKTSDLHLIEQGPSPLEELANQWQDIPIILNDPYLTHDIPLSLHERIKINQETIPPKITEQLATLKETYVDLPMGMQASITPTPALTAIDMDSMNLSDNNQSKLRSQFQANRTALPFVLHQLKLRNLSGAIFLDVIGLPIKKRRLLQQDIETALAKDPLSPRLLGFTHLGLAEIIRPRRRSPLHEMLNSNHGQAIDILDRVLQEFYTVKNHHRYHKINLQMNMHLYQALKKDPWAIKDFEYQSSVSLQLKPNPAFTRQQWEFSYE